MKSDTYHNLQQNHLEQKVTRNFDWFNLNGSITADVDIKKSTCREQMKRRREINKKGRWISTY